MGWFNRKKQKEIELQETVEESITCYFNEKGDITVQELAFILKMHMSGGFHRDKIDEIPDSVKRHLIFKNKKGDVIL